MTPLLRLAAALAFLLAALPAAAQAPSPRTAGATVRIVDESPGAVTYEVTASWDRALTAPASLASADALAASLVGSEATATALVPLGARVPPHVEVLALDADEIRLDGAGRLAEAFGGPVAEVVGVGTRRKETVGSLRVRLLAIDGDRVRRVRRALVRVHRTAPAGGAALRVGGGSSHLAVTRSALAEGTWFKLSVPESGVYRIDRALIESLGLAPDAIDPNRVAAYHNGGAPLPALAGAPRPADLVETPSLVIGGGDGSFDEGDAVILYAQGPRTWTWDEGNAADPDDDAWSHTLNPFTAETVVFLRVDAPNARRVGGATFPNWMDAEPLTTITNRLLAERDLVNLEREDSGSGLDWLGEEITRSTSGVTVLDTLPPNLVGPVAYRARVAAAASPSITISILHAGQTLQTVRPFAVSFGSPTGPLATTRIAEGTAAPQGSLALTVQAPGAPSSATAWLDWAEAVYERTPRQANGIVHFPTPGGERGRFEVALEGFAAAPEVWDVTTPGGVTRLGVQPESGRYRVQVEATDREREVVAFDPGAALRRFSGGEPVRNQNLHGITSYPDFVIIVPEVLAPAAERLAAHRQSDGLETLVVDVDAVLNEFGGGVSDMRAIRDYMKFLYDRADTEDRLPRYLLLFGDGHYDFRGIENGPPSLVPTYQTDEMLWREKSYTSDDYFALLDDDEGKWAWTGTASTVSFERVDLGVGRLPVRTLEDAERMVDKIFRYESAETLGDWRTRFTFLADDQYPNDNDADLHVQNADAVAVRVPDSTGVVVQKIYMPSYPEVTGGTGRRRPGATEASRRAIEEGTLIWNYMGHGGPEGLADEQLFTADVADGLSNADRLPIFVTATCSFGKYDMVDDQSLAEETLLHEGGGAIAMFTTVRVVLTFYSPTSLNLGLNIALTREMLARDEQGRPQRLGDILEGAKNTDVGAQLNNRKFNLLGDPTMRIGLPERRVEITPINGVAVPTDTPPSLRAFEQARVQGRVLRFDGTPDPAFQGEIALNVFDAAREVQLPVRVHTPGVYTIQTDPIYSGRASVRGGTFDASFLVPQDVSYSGRPARITTYALGDAGDGLTDGLGQTASATVAQDAGARPNDLEGPSIRLFLDDTTFVSGGLTRPDPVLIARLQDPSGINTVGAGVGHELLLTLDGDPSQAVDVGRSYEGDLDTYTSGTVRFPLADLTPGRHSVTLTAWDGANNASTEVLEFVVAEGSDLEVRNAYPYPNPTSGPSAFFFEHNQPPGTMGRVQLRIYSLSGRPVRTLEMEGPLTSGHVRMDWDGLDDDADRLASGIYLYRLRVEVDGQDGTRRVAERRDKLAVIR